MGLIISVFEKVMYVSEIDMPGYLVMLYHIKYTVCHLLQ